MFVANTGVSELVVALCRSAFPSDKRHLCVGNCKFLKERKMTYYYFQVRVGLFLCSVGGIVVSIAAFQAVDPGSIPGRRKSAFHSLICFLV